MPRRVSHAVPPPPGYRILVGRYTRYEVPPNDKNIAQVTEIFLQDNCYAPLISFVDKNDKPSPWHGKVDWYTEDDLRLHFRYDGDVTKKIHWCDLKRLPSAPHVFLGEDYQKRPIRLEFQEQWCWSQATKTWVTQEADAKEDPQYPHAEDPPPPPNGPAPMMAPAPHARGPNANPFLLPPSEDC